MEVVKFVVDLLDGAGLFQLSVDDDVGRLAPYRRGHLTHPLHESATPRRHLVAEAARGPLELSDSAYAPGAHAAATIRALADRGLIKLRAGPNGLRRRFEITPKGRERFAEIVRRAEVREKLRRGA